MFAQTFINYYLLMLTFGQWSDRYPTDDACLEAILLLSNPTKSCPSCGYAGSPISKLPNRRAYQCGICRHQVYPTKNTIFEKTTTPLRYWFFAIFLFTTSKNGLSAKEVERQLGVTYKTAYRMLSLIRSSSCQDLISGDQMSGMIELDEAFVGGKNRNRHIDKKVKSHGRYQPDKSLVFGMREHGGKVRAYVVPDAAWITLKPFIIKHIEKGSEVYTDELPSYRKMKKFYHHEYIQHGKKNFRHGNCSTNGVENLWSVLKRTVRGSYVHVSKQHVQSYVDEVVFRFNNRNNPYIFDDLLSISCGVLPSPYLQFFEDS